MTMERTGTEDVHISSTGFSWGAVLAGTAVMITLAALIRMLALAIILATAPTSGAGLRHSFVAMAIVGWGATLVAALIGGVVAGFLPRHAGRSMGGLHGLLSACVAFVLAALVALWFFGGVLRAAQQTVGATAGAAAQVTSRAVGAGEQGQLSRTAVNLLNSLGYSRPEAERLVTEAQQGLQQGLRRAHTAAPAVGGQIQQGVRGALQFASGFMWLTWGTWIFALILGFVGGGWGGRLLLRRGRAHVVGPQPATTPSGPLIYPPTPRPVGA
jgi:hypothetical protein